MKRALSRITKRHIAGIRKWLKSDEPEKTCPFVKIKDRAEGCHSIFPRLETPGAWNWEHSCVVVCPCGQYTLAHVRRVAKQVLDEVS